VEECIVPKIGHHDPNGRHQQAIASVGIDRQESSSPIQFDVHFIIHVLDLVLLSVIKDHHIPIIRGADLCQVARVQIGGSHFDVVGREGMFGEVV
jgi:hypothetical protein